MIIDLNVDAEANARAMCDRHNIEFDSPVGALVADFVEMHWAACKHFVVQGELLRHTIQEQGRVADALGEAGVTG